jgi:hypothetical protein
MKPKNGSLAGKRILDRLWEDTIIIALRDLQWAKSIERGQARPGSLLKLDGNAETALGDAITDAGERFFLFEFKSEAGAGGSEFKKPLVSIMKEVARLPESSESRARFESASRAAHHFVFPIHNPATTDTDATVEVKAHVVTHGYYDAAVAMVDTAYTLSAGPDIVSMLYPSNHGTKYGLKLAWMATYLEYLVRRFKEWAEGQPKSKRRRSGAKPVAIPMKALVWSDAGFFWPVADMADIEDVVRVLNGHHHASHMQSQILLTDYPDRLSLDRAAGSTGTGSTPD